MHRLAFALALLAAPAFAGGLGQMTPAERDAFRAEVRQYLLDNPEVINEAMAVLKDKQDKAAALADTTALAAAHDAVFKDPNSWVGGNPDGNITVVEFMDYRCGYCRKGYEEVADLVKTDGNIRFIVKEFPILGDASMTSAKFAIAVRLVQGDAAYYAVHQALITLRGQPDAETLSRLAGTLGYDPAPILAKMDSPEVAGIIQANYALAIKLNIDATPTFVIDTKMLRGYVPEDGMKQMNAAARAG